MKNLSSPMEIGANMSFRVLIDGKIEGCKNRPYDIMTITLPIPMDIWIKDLVYIVQYVEQKTGFFVLERVLG